MKENKIISKILIVYIILLTFNKSIKIISIPIYYFPMFFLLTYIAINDIKYKKTIKLNLFFVFWIFYAVLLMLFSGFSVTSGKALLSLITNISSFVIITRLFDKNFEYMKDAILGIKISVIINVIIAIWEIITKSHVIILTEDYVRRFSGIPLTFYANANDLSVVLTSYVIILLIDIYMRKDNKDNNRNMLFSVSLIMIAYYIIIKTGSLIGICAFPAIIFLTIFFSKYYRKKNKYFFIIILTVILFLYLTVGESIKLEQYSTFNSRFDIWKSTLALFISSKGLGIGPGRNEILGVGQAHFLLLEILSEYGIIIFITFIKTYLEWMLKTRKLVINKSRNSKICFTILSFAIILPILSISTSSMTKLYPTWIAIAICFAIIKKSEKMEVNK